MTLPRSLKKRKKPKEYKLRSFVAMLFLAAIFLVGFAHVFYHQQVLQRAYFEKIRLNKEDRVLKLFNNEGIEIGLGYLGINLPIGEKVYHCLSKDQTEDSVCLQWMHRARLHIKYKEKQGVRCYQFTWQSLSPNTKLTDCFKTGDQHGHWYGGGKTQEMAWPMELGRVNTSAFVTGQNNKHPWGSVLRRYFISSKGVALSIDSKTPLYLSINTEMEKSLCLHAKHDDFAYINHDGLPVLNYSVCTSSNMKQLHSFLSEKSLWDGLKEEDVNVIQSIITEPVWQIAPLNKGLLNGSAIVNYTERIIALGFLKQGHVLLNEHWQNHVGDLTIDSERFQAMDETIDTMRRRGFRITFSVQPFIGTESRNFALTVNQGLLVQERGDGEGTVPALTRYKSVSSAGMLDITNNHTVSWISKQLKGLVEKYNIDSFYLDMGTAYDMPKYYRLQDDLTNPDDYKSIFTEHTLKSIRVIGVSGAVTRPPAPVFVSLPPLPSTWESLQSIIPTILTYGIVGYPFLMPGPVGGDYLPESLRQITTTTTTPNPQFVFDPHLPIGDLRVFEPKHLPNKELYMRWQQLANFLPVIRYTHLPSDYVSDKDVLQQAKDLTSLRIAEVVPRLINYVTEALDKGLPLIRPLWMLDPSDSACLLVMDEFSIGEELIVAPIVAQGVEEREVYLPAGVWKDGIDGSLRKGSRWLHSYKVPLDKIAYFVRMPNNTRF